MPTPTLSPATPDHASQAAELVYASSHELLEFMFRSKPRAIAVLAKLFQKAKGHFSHSFATFALANGELAGLELGYSTEDLKKTELAGNLNLVLSSPLSLWPHIVFKVGKIASAYVPQPSPNAYYINNLAVAPSHRGSGVGRLLIEDAIPRAKKKGLLCLELDVTADNQNAIGFYQKLGFAEQSRTESKAVFTEHRLPALVRMRLSI